MNQDHETHKDYESRKEDVRNSEKLQQTTRQVFNRIVARTLPLAVVSTIKHALDLGFSLAPNKDGTFYLSPPEPERKVPLAPKELSFPQSFHENAEIAEYFPGPDGKAIAKSVLKIFFDGKILLPASKSKEESESLDCFSKRLRAVGWTHRKFLRQGRRLNGNDWRPAGKLFSVVSVLIDGKQVIVPLQVDLRAMLQMF
jgi:hypothetical protein